MTFLPGYNLPVCEDHRVDNPDYNTKARRERYPPENFDRSDNDWWIRFDKIFFDFTTFQKFFVFGGPVKLEFFKWNSTRKNHYVHRKFFGTEMRIEEMDCKDETGCKQCLVAVDDRCDVDNPAR